MHKWTFLQVELQIFYVALLVYGCMGITSVIGALTHRWTMFLTLTGAVVLPISIGLLLTGPGLPR